MQRTIRALAALIAILPAGVVVAHGEKGVETPQGWSGSVAAGYVAVRGNSDSTNSNLKGQLFYDTDRWHHSGLVTAIGASQDGDTSSEAYKAELKTKYDLAQAIYTFGVAEYNKDRFSGYDHQSFEVVGLGWRVLRTKTQELNLEAGVGATQSKLRQPDPPQPPLASSERDVNEFIGRVGGDYHWHLSENAVFSQKLSGSFGSENTYYESLTELKAGIIGDVALVLGYLAKHNTDVPAGVDKTDTQTSISLEFKF